LEDLSGPGDPEVGIALPAAFIHGVEEIWIALERSALRRMNHSALGVAHWIFPQGLHVNGAIRLGIPEVRRCTRPHPGGAGQALFSRSDIGGEIFRSVVEAPGVVWLVETRRRRKSHDDQALATESTP
jgi:hypothetical protein